MTLFKDAAPIIFQSQDGFDYSVDTRIWHVPSLTIQEGNWVCFAPQTQESFQNPSLSLSRILMALEDPIKGTIELFCKNVENLTYGERLKLRQKMGFVPGTGGLFSNRNVFENIEYPLIIHTKLDKKIIHNRIAQLLVFLGLTQYRDYRPHMIDGHTRWRTCVARALVTHPAWLVMEDVGDFHFTGGKGRVWTYLETLTNQPLTFVVALSQRWPNFERWFQKNGGQIIIYGHNAE